MYNAGKRLCSMLFIFPVFLFLFTVGLCANTLEELRDTIREKIKNKLKNPHVSMEVMDIIRNYEPNLIVAQAIELTRDPNDVERKIGYELLENAGYQSHDPALRKAIVLRLVESLSEPDEPDAGKRQEILLRDYVEADYTAEAREKLYRHFNEFHQQPSPYHSVRSDLILLIGAADIREATDQLDAIIHRADEPLQPFGTWAKNTHEMAFTALKAKARMGDENAVERCIALVDSVEDEDFKILRLLKHIQYIRQPKAAEYIKQFLYSDKKLRDLGPDAKGSPYAYMAALHLDKMIAGFPTQLEARNAYWNKLSEPGFLEKWPSLDTYYGEYCRQWIEKQERIEIIR
jgi:hypothetical protein